MRSLGYVKLWQANFLMCYWGGAMVGRFIGSAVLQKLKTGLVLGFAAVFAGILILISIKTTFTSGIISTYPMHLLHWQWTSCYGTFAPNVGDAGGWILQLDYVPVDLHAGRAGSGAVDQQGIEPADRSHCWRRADPTFAGQTCRPYWPASVVHRPGDLLHLHCVLWLWH